MTARVAVGVLGVLMLAAAPSAQAAVSRAWLDARAALSACMAEQDHAVRGACLERAVMAMDAVEARGEGPVPSPEQSRKERARDFGLRLPPAPKLPRLTRRVPEAERPDRLSTTLASARLDAEGKWIMVTTEGATWAQTDQSAFARPPHAGSAFLARPGSLGSYFCLVDGRHEVRCKRRGG